MDRVGLDINFEKPMESKMQITVAYTIYRLKLESNKKFFSLWIWSGRCCYWHESNDLEYRFTSRDI